MDQARRAVRTREDGTAEDRSLSALPPLLNQAQRNLELLGRATGELSNDRTAAANITLVRVLSVPRMPDVQTVPGFPAAPAERVIDAPADVDMAGEIDERGSDSDAMLVCPRVRTTSTPDHQTIPPRNRR